MWTVVYSRPCRLHAYSTWACKCIDWLLDAWARFCCKNVGGQLGVKPIWSSGWCRSALCILISNFISRGVLRATLITLCFVLADDLHISILIFVAGHGTVVQPASINIVFGCKQAQQYSRSHYLGFIRAVSWSAQNAEPHWSHVHVTLTVGHFSFHAFYKKCGYSAIWCLVQIA